MDHILYDCERVKEERRMFKTKVMISDGNWPLDKSEMTGKYVKHFIKFVESIILRSCSISLFMI